MKRDLIVFGEDWGGLPSSTQHLIKRLQRHYRVFWINSIGLRQPTLSLRDLNRMVNKCQQTLNSDKSADKVPATAAETANNDNEPMVLKPITIPAPSTQLARKMATWLLKCQLLPVFKRLGVKNPVVWTSLPTAADICSELSPSRVLYYCGDDFGALAGVDHDTVRRHESELVAKADIILAASRELASRFPPTKTHLLPHGVDIDLFSQPAPRALDLPKDGKPIAGFYGSLSSWLDYDLLHKVASHLPDWHFVFIGKIEAELGALPSLSNVHLLGPRAHHQLPGYSQHWQVSMLPFLDNPQIQACNPLKLLEYLAADTPIVSTRFPAVERWQEQVNLVSDPGEMIRTLQLLRHNRHNTAANGAKTDLSDYSWDNRAEEIYSLLEHI